jgi:hypothetical protein
MPTISQAEEKEIQPCKSITSFCFQNRFFDVALVADFLLRTSIIMLLVFPLLLK